MAEYPIQLQNPWEMFEDGGLVLDKSKITEYKGVLPVNEARNIDSKDE